MLSRACIGVLGKRYELSQSVRLSEAHRLCRLQRSGHPIAFSLKAEIRVGI